MIENKKNIPICPHGGGIGLCNMVIHFAVWDQIAIANESDTQLVEYLEFLQDDVFIHTISLKKGRYSLPNASGWGIQMTDHFLKQHSFPNGVVWKN